MLEVSSPSPKLALRRSIAWLLTLDALVAVAHGGLWVFMEFVTPAVAIALSLLRISSWIACALYLLTDVRAWERVRDNPSEAQLLAAHTALESFGPRISRIITAGWLACDGLWAGLGFAGVPVELPFGRAELVAALMLSATLFVLPLLFAPAADHPLASLQATLRTAILDRRIETSRSVPPISHVLARLVTASFLAAFVGIFGVAIKWRVDGVRASSVVEQQRRVELIAAGVSPERDESLASVEIVTTSALPDFFGALIDPLERPTLIASHDPRRELAFAAMPLEDGRWAISAAEPDEELGLLSGLVLLLVVLSGPVFWATGWVYGRSISSPLHVLTEAAQRFVERGDLRALARTVSLHDSELGRLSRSFNGMLDTLEGLALAAGAVAEGDLSVELDRPGELHDAFRGMLARLNETVSSLRETSLELGSAATEIQALTQQQDAAVQQQSAGMRQVSATVGELAESAQSIASTAKSVLGNAERAADTTDTMSQKITALRDHVTSVTQLLEVIREIADRSDLLALNGSLEATRAGEAGRGFALVAAEMRRLAERVTQTVGDVRERVTNIESSSSSTVTATEHSRALAQLTADAARQISTVIAQQSQSTEEVAAGVQALAEVSITSAAAVSQTRAAALGLRAHADELERLISSFQTR